MPEYVVVGEKGAEVDVLGTLFKVGDKVVMAEEVAAPLLDSGKIGKPEPLPSFSNENDMDGN